MALTENTVAITESVVKRKLKIRITSKGVLTDSKEELRERSIHASKKDDCSHGISVDAKTRSVMNSVTKLPTPANSNKRAPQAKLAGEPGKRRKMDRSVVQQCGSILKTLMDHPAGWVFNQPVDPVALNIPNYFSIIKNPMDLGTIKSKLHGNLYFDADEFAADVRLTFSNAMLYNPPPNTVNSMAKELDAIFNRKWKLLESKWKNGSKGLELNGREISTKRDINVASRTTKVDSIKGIQGGGTPISVKIVHRGTNSGSRSSCGSVIAKHSMTYRCSVSNTSAHASSIDSSEISSMRDHSGAAITDIQAKSSIVSSSSKSDPDSDDSGSAFGGESGCSSPRLSTFASTATAAAAAAEDYTPLIDAQMSPKRALRVAMLKSRFADTIVKAKQKMLQGDKSDPVKLQEERDRLEKQQHEEKARIEEQIKAAEAASRMRMEAELKLQREREREAARIAMRKMEKTIQMDDIDNLMGLRDLETLLYCSTSDYSEAFAGGHLGNALERLGLYLKEEYREEDDDDEAILVGDEEGEILL